MFQYVSYYFVLVLKLLQNLFGCYVLTSLGLFGLLYYLKFVEEYLANLFGRCDIESFTSQLVDTSLNLVHAVGKLF